MCPTTKLEDGCIKTTCDDICRTNLACTLANASQLDILTCRGVQLLDVDYGFEYLVSEF